jgi:hypothetical protein
VTSTPARADGSDLSDLALQPLVGQYCSGSVLTVGLLALSLSLCATLALRMPNARANTKAAATIMPLVIMVSPLAAHVAAIAVCSVVDCDGHHRFGELRILFQELADGIPGSVAQVSPGAQHIPTPLA